MNRKYLWRAVIGILLSCAAISRAQPLPPIPVAMDEYPDLPYAVSGPIFPLPKLWSYQDGDDKEYSKENYHDSDWKKVEVGQALTGGGWRWYRVAFDLPKELEKRNLLLDLGRISVYDEVFVNGVEVGRYGSPPPRLVQGATGIWRRYPIAAEHFHTGRNVLAIRVFVGYRGGLYEGPYTLQALADNAVIGKLNLKTGGADALETLLNESPHFNTFAPGAPLLVGPDLLQFFGEPRRGRLRPKL